MTDALASVMAHVKKACAAELLGRWSRAAELHARALSVVLAAADEPLGIADSLIAADLRLRRCDALLSQSLVPGAEPAEAAALCSALWHVVCEAVHTLRARWRQHTGSASSPKKCARNRLKQLELLGSWRSLRTALSWAAMLPYCKPCT
jgi:hypothetical protein